MISTTPLIGTRAKWAIPLVTHFFLVIFGIFLIDISYDNRGARDTSEPYPELFTLLVTIGIASSITYLYGLIRIAYLFTMNIDRIHIGFDLLYYLANAFGFMAYIWCGDLLRRMNNINRLPEFEMLYNALEASLIIYTIIYLGFLGSITYSLVIKYYVKDKYKNSNNTVERVEV
ncbi:MAG: hypothetical protein CMF62_03525 [Magnetococcales bacterium]|nr:hypothetical protein [Magnetococcales bacterium]|tara:strand:+ start:48800 stop:49321 length:522 start_codon:yes stop_codon:yes gene_type:complete